MSQQTILQPLDYAVILLYLISLIAIGFFISLHKRQSQDLFLAGRQLGWFSIGLSIWGTNISPSMMLASCSIAYTTGMVASTFSWFAWYCLLLLGMVFLPYYLRTRISTMPEFLEKRFDSRCRRFLSFYVLLSTLVLWLGTTLYVSGLLLSQLIAMPLWLAMLLLLIVATSFTVAGGLAAVVYTDSFQAILMIGMSITLTVIVFTKIGGIAPLIQSTPKEYWSLFKPVDDPAFPWPALVFGYPVIGVWFWCTDQTIVQRALGARNLQQGQLGTLFPAFIKVVEPFIFFLPGILCFVLHPDLGNPDLAYTKLVTTYLPVGLVGLVVAVLIAALISTLDSGLNSFSTVFTLDVYRIWWNPGAAQAKTRLVGRLATLLAAAITFFCAWGLSAVGKDLFNLFQSIIAFFAPPLTAVFLVGMLWKKATARAAFVTLVVGCPVSVTFGLGHILNWPANFAWPHYLLVSLYLFLFLALLMIALSLFKPEKPAFAGKPPTFSGISKKQNPSLGIWIAWAVLAMIMAAIYLIFS